MDVVFDFTESEADIKVVKALRRTFIDNIKGHLIDLYHEIPEESRKEVTMTELLEKCDAGVESLLPIIK